MTSVGLAPNQGPDNHEICTGFGDSKLAPLGDYAWDLGRVRLRDRLRGRERPKRQCVNILMMSQFTSFP